MTNWTKIVLVLAMATVVAGCGGNKQVNTLPKMPTEVVKAVNGICTCAGQTWACPSLAIPNKDATEWNRDAREQNLFALAWGNAPKSVLDKCLVTTKSWVWTKPLD